MITHQELRTIADQRMELHRNSPGRRPLSPDYEYVGLVGEAEFARLMGLPMNVFDRPGGDAGVDFTLVSGHTVDVKTFRRANNLIQEIGKIRADIYVLAQYDDDSDRAVVLGWHWGSELAKAPTRDFGYGIITHYIPAKKLLPISILKGQI